MASIIILLLRDLVNHDSLIYAILGNALSFNPEIVYSDFIYVESYKIISISNHGYGFPLFKTIENLFNINNFQSDNYYRFIPFLNSGLLLLNVYYFSISINKKLAEYLVFTVALTGAFIFLTTTYGSSSISYNLFLISVYLTNKVIKHSRMSDLLLLGISSGLGSFVHSLNFILLPILLLFIVFFNTSKLYKKVYYLVLVLIFNFAFGGIHYYLETIIGDGWIFGKGFGLIRNFIGIFNKFFELEL